MPSLFDLLSTGQLAQGDAPDIDALVARLIGQPGIVNQPGIAMTMPAANTATPAPAAAPVAAPAASPAPMAPKGAPALPQRGFGQVMQDLGDALQGKGVTDYEGRNLTYQALVKKGIEPEIAMAAVRNPEMLKGLIAQHFGAGQFGLNPIYTKDDQGNIVLGQLSNRGGLRPVALPPGSTPLEPPKAVNLGTSQLILGGKTGTPMANVPIDVAGKEAAEETGKATGKARVDLPRVELNSKFMLDKIDALMNDPGLDAVIGPVDSRTPTIRPDSARAEARIAEIQGGAFLQAFETLKGGGAITEKEGEKATDALNRLNRRGVSEADYRDALREFRGQVVKLTELARQRAGGGAPASDGWVTLGNGIRLREKR